MALSKICTGAITCKIARAIVYMDITPLGVADMSATRAVTYAIAGRESNE